MATTHRIANPFALMLDPQAVLAQIERSQRLEGLQRRVCRPLDRPLLAKVDDEDGAEVKDFDRAIESAGDDPADGPEHGQTPLA